MSRVAPAFVIAYHGGERDECMAAVSECASLRKSDQKHDWLGAGTYFWESDSQRAMEWAEEKRQFKLCKVPFVVGAVIDLGNCLDLTLRSNLDLLERVHADFAAAQKQAGFPMPENKDSPRVKSKNKVMRTLDCAILNYLHEMNKQAGLEDFDTVRGVFEGLPAFAGSEIYRKTHIQIAVRNESCIKAVFRPR